MESHIGEFVWLSEIIELSEDFNLAHRHSLKKGIILYELLACSCNFKFVICSMNKFFIVLKAIKRSAEVLSHFRRYPTIQLLK